jgi:hypothetical protein
MTGRSWRSNTTSRPEFPAEQKLADELADELYRRIAQTIEDHPRSLQKLIGPSEIGVPCMRALLHKLHQDEEPKRGDPPWKPTVGTAVHAYMEQIFGAPERAADGWLVENRLVVGNIGEHVISGSCDLWLPGFVIDWKFVGPSRLKLYKSKGPGEQYRKQAHLYGKGWEDRGEPVQLVVIAFVPRDGELRDAYLWWEPYDRAVAEAALKRANAAYDLLTGLGLEGALALYPECGDRWCDWCTSSNAVVLSGTTDDLNNVLKGI